MRAQAFSEKQSMGMMMSQKTMELNPRHPIINELLTKVKDEKTDEDTENLAWLLLDNALMQSGFQPADVEPEHRRLQLFRAGGAGVADYSRRWRCPTTPRRRRTRRTRWTWTRRRRRRGAEGRAPAPRFSSSTPSTVFAATVGAYRRFLIPSTGVEGAVRPVVEPRLRGP